MLYKQSAVRRILIVWRASWAAAMLAANERSAASHLHSVFDHCLLCNECV